MKLIIDIPEDVYNKLLKEQRFPSGFNLAYPIIHGRKVGDRKECAGRIIKESEAAYCGDCDHAEMCSWYGTIGCECKTEPKRGKWLTKQEPNSAEPIILFKCSRCNEDLGMTRPVVGDKIIYNYCPFCGAKMEEEKE